MSVLPDVELRLTCYVWRQENSHMNAITDEHRKTLQKKGYLIEKLSNFIQHDLTTNRLGNEARSAYLKALLKDGL